MKNIFLKLFLLIIVFSSCKDGKIKFESHVSSVSFEDSEGKYGWTKPKFNQPEQLNIQIDESKSEIIITSSEIKIFQIKKVVKKSIDEKGRIHHVWDCIDKSGNRCDISLLSFNDKSSPSIIVNYLSPLKVQYTFWGELVIRIKSKKNINNKENRTSVLYLMDSILNVSFNSGFFKNLVINSDIELENTNREEANRNYTKYEVEIDFINDYVLFYNSFSNSESYPKFHLEEIIPFDIIGKKQKSKGVIVLKFENTEKNKSFIGNEIVIDFRTRDINWFKGKSISYSFSNFYYNENL